MARRLQSPNNDKSASVSPKGDTKHALFDVLRQARLSHELSQQALASKLGVHQRQISDLERGAMDPRLSTVQNVSRALDLELMLVPHHLIEAVEGLQRASTHSTRQPIYALGDDEDKRDSGETSRTEVGSNVESDDATTRPRHLPKATR